MPEIDLGYGESAVALDYDDSQYTVLTPDSTTEIPLRDEQIGNAFDSPIDSPPLDEIVSGNDSVLIVVSDGTRATGSSQIVNLLIRRLIQYGVSPSSIAIIFATGIHRPVTPEERIDLLSPFVAQRIRTLDHDAYKPGLLTKVGMTDGGDVVERRHQGQVVGDLVDGRVVGQTWPDQDVRIGRGGDVAQHLRQLSLAELAGSTGAVAQAGQAWIAGVLCLHCITSLRLSV